MKEEYKELFGIWRVTTEANEDGTRTTNLGFYEGYVDEIAFHLADKCYYSLRFEKIIPITSFVAKEVEVRISFDSASETWHSVETDKGHEEIVKIFQKRPVEVRKDNHFACIRLFSHKADEIKRQKALDKLSVEEKKLLGLS